jgi:hypothetical protein
MITIQNLFMLYTLACLLGCDLFQHSSNNIPGLAIQRLTKRIQMDKANAIKALALLIPPWPG